MTEAYPLQWPIGRPRTDALKRRPGRCDTFHRLADNIAAIAAHIEATRAIERYGVATVEDMFRGFAALPSRTSKNWRVVLGLPMERAVSREDVEAAYRRRAKDCHPDAEGGSHEAMAALNAARAEAIEQLAAAEI